MKLRRDLEPEWATESPYRLCFWVGAAAEWFITSVCADISRSAAPLASASETVWPSGRDSTGLPTLGRGKGSDRERERERARVRAGEPAPSWNNGRDETRPSCPPAAVPMITSETFGLHFFSINAVVTAMSFLEPVGVRSVFNPRYVERRTGVTELALMIPTASSATSIRRVFAKRIICARSD